MGRFDPQIIEEVRSRTNIGDLIGQYVKLQRRGNRMVGLCPFHDEKTPSFSVSVERGVYHCFGCGASGDSIGFLIRHDGLAFPDAVRHLAERVGIELREEEGGDPESGRRRRDERERYLAATAFARAFYEEQLHNGRFPAATEYLRQRDVSPDVARAFSLGFAPPSWSALIEAAERRRFPIADLDAAGLIGTPSDSQKRYDRFRNRIMFPVVNLGRQVLAFSGRTLDPAEKAKYVNSPETPFYTKGNELFGLVSAQKAIRESGEAVLVEGNFDVVSVHARGVCQACAALGTALTPVQARLLRRFTARVVLCYDGDSAGRAAARRALGVLHEVGLHDVRLVTLPDRADPDSFVRAEGGDALKARIAAARPMLDLCIDEAVAPGVGADPTSKLRAVERVADLLRPVHERLIWQQHVSRIAQRLELDERQVVDHIRATRTVRSDSAPIGVGADPHGTPASSGVSAPLSAPVERANAESTRPGAPLAALDPVCATMVQALCDDGALLARFHREEARYLLEPLEVATWIGEVAQRWVEQGGVGLAESIRDLPAGPMQALLTALWARPRAYVPEAVHASFDGALVQLKRRWLTGRLRALSEKIRALETAGAHEEAAALYAKTLQYNEMLRDLGK